MPEPSVANEVKHVMLPGQQRLADGRAGDPTFERHHSDGVAEFRQRVLDDRAFHRDIQVEPSGMATSTEIETQRVAELVDRLVQVDIAGQRSFGRRRQEGVAGAVIGELPRQRGQRRGVDAQAQAKPFVVVVLHPAEAFVIEVPHLAGEQRITQRPADRGQEVAIDRAVGQPLSSGGHLGRIEGK